MTSPTEDTNSFECMSERDSMLNASRWEISETDIEQNKELLEKLMKSVYCIYVGNNEIYYSRPYKAKTTNLIKKKSNARYALISLFHNLINQMFRINNDGQKNKVVWLRAPFSGWVLYTKAKEVKEFNIGCRPICENFMFHKEGAKGMPLKLVRDSIKKNPNAIIAIEKLSISLTDMENVIYQRESVHELFRYLDEIEDGLMYRTGDGVTFQRIKDNNSRETFFIKAPEGFISRVAFDAAKKCYKLSFVRKSGNKKNYFQNEITFQLIFEALEEGYFNTIALEELITN
ncbi:hypothetical protein T4B_2269 [Trichinella pseudospiralis]|uniref:Uncharacterized protein n=1 Tax=Trichinella pseudospiralis TaxID=6337 RepID=A0A0V1JJH5_TRIPS|nr:hypothetical protein T4B_2269 [Trichinella pseudospiralis]